MKYICILMLLTLAASVGFAQINLSYTTALNRVTYALEEADTSVAQYVAGANSLVLVVTSEDSAQLDVVVQYKKNGTWTTILTDSLCTTTAAGATQEYSIKDTDSDLCDGIYYPLRVILTGQTDVLNMGVTTPYVTARWYYRL